MAIGTPVRSRTTFKFGPAPTKPLHSPTLTSDTRQEWRLVHKVAKDHEAAILKATLEGFAKARATIDTDALALEIHKSGHAYSIDWQAISDAFASSFLPSISDTGKDAAITLLPSFKKQVQDAHPLARASEVFLDPPGAWAKLGLDLQHSGANDFLSWYTPNKITAVTSQIQGIIGSVIEGSFKNGVDVYYQANAIKHMIGLSGPQSVAYSNRAQALWNQGLTGPKINAMMEAWTQKAIQYRATVIARTESLRAANQGQKMLWKDAEGSGLLDPGSTSQVWIATPDDRECEICAALDGKAVDLDGAWTSDISGATEDTPPIHTSCRCAMGLDFTQAPQTPTGPPAGPDETVPEPVGASIGDVDFPNYTEDPKYAPTPGLLPDGTPDFNSKVYVTDGPAKFIRSLEGPDWTRYAKNLEQDQYNSFRSYTGSGFNGINGVLRGEINPNFMSYLGLSQEQIDRDIKNMDVAFDKVPALPKDVDLFRNIDAEPLAKTLGRALPDYLDSATGKEYAKELTETLNGTVISDPAYLSSTVDPRAAFDGRSVQMTIETPKGSKVVYLEDITKNKREYEVLFPRGSHLQIKSVEFDQRKDFNGKMKSIWKITVRLLAPVVP